MPVLELMVGALITIVEPGTTTSLCARVVQVGEGVGGIPMVWAVQAGGSRALKAPVSEVKAGCESAATANVPAPRAAMPAPSAPAMAMPVKS